MKATTISNLPTLEGLALSFCFALACEQPEDSVYDPDEGIVLSSEPIDEPEPEPEGPQADGEDLPKASLSPLDLEVVDATDGSLIVKGEDFRVRIHRARRVAELNVSEERLDHWLGAPLEDWSPEATARLYEVFADDFDFIVFVPPTQSWHPALTRDGESLRVRNYVDGLGMPLFDDGAVYGSPVRLQSLTMLAGFDLVAKGPLLRELGGRWANRGFIPSAVPGAWGFADVGGVLGGCSPDEMFELGEDVWYCDFNGGTNWSPAAAPLNDRIYARLELYMMGLVPPEGVPPVQYVADGVWLDEATGVFTGEAEIIDVHKLLAIHGPRSPSEQDSQREFRTLFVMLSGGELVGLDKLNIFDNHVAEFAAPKGVLNGEYYNFWEASSGLASLDATDLDASLL